MKDGSALRKEILAARNQLSRKTIDNDSRLIARLLLGLNCIQRSTTIFTYVSFRSEVATETLIDSLLDMGKVVCVPITRVREKRLDVVRITNRDSDLAAGYCDIPEPTEELFAHQSIDPGQIDVILLPGSVFDRRGGRFGYGGGYYDRFVSDIPKAIRIGLAFDLQLVDRAPLAAHDELLDYIVTEKRIVIGERK